MDLSLFFLKVAEVNAFCHFLFTKAYAHAECLILSNYAAISSSFMHITSMELTTEALGEPTR